MDRSEKTQVFFAYELVSKTLCNSSIITIREYTDFWEDVYDWLCDN